MRSNRTAIARATAATLIVWVSRLCTTPLVAIAVTTCVTSASRAKAVANRIRSRSVRDADSPGAYDGSGSCRDLASRASMVGTLPKALSPDARPARSGWHPGVLAQVIEVDEPGSV